MSEEKRSNQMIIKDVVFFSKIIYTLVCSILFYSFGDYTFMTFTDPWEFFTLNIFKIKDYLPFTISLFSLLVLVYISNKKEYNTKVKFYDIIECSFFISMFIYVLYRSGWIYSNNKFIPIFLVVIYTMELNSKFGNIISGICSFIILLPFIGAEQVGEIASIFQQDLVLCSTFFLVTNILGIYIKLQNEYTQNLINISNKDGLTGVYNRGYFNKYYLKKCEDNTCKSLSLIIFDIDYFKTYNDNNGHVQGDLLLKRLSALVMEIVGDRGIFARYGGEEFVVISEDKSYDEMMLIAEEVRYTIEKTHFDFQEKQPNKNVTVSVGVSSYPTSVAYSKDLIESADQALYHSKENGRNKVTGYSETSTI